MSHLNYTFLGRCSYARASKLQQSIIEQVRVGGEQCLLAVEHDPVITIGRRGRTSDILVPHDWLEKHGVSIHQADRGGEVTYHGPGQLVLYPIVRVDPRRLGVSELISGLLSSISGFLTELEIIAETDDQSPGLWVNNAKICAVGMRVRRGVSSHGAAVNLTTSLEAFDWIVSCGMANARTTSVAVELGDPSTCPSLEAAGRNIAGRFARHFAFEISPRR